MAAEGLVVLVRSYTTGDTLIAQNKQCRILQAGGLIKTKGSTIRGECE